LDSTEAAANAGEIELCVSGSLSSKIGRFDIVNRFNFMQLLEFL
jgi:hypothetical protein